jgi:serine/threonine protein kinase
MSSSEWGNSLLGNNFLASRYEIQQQLAKKAGRRTLLARDRQSGELVVVKLLSFGSDFEWDDLKLFEREAETLRALSHPAIPRYLDYFELDLSNNGKGFALVQTYIPAKSLEAYLKTGRNFSEVEVRKLAKALLKILIYLHGRQPPVIHRDIKPSNILLGAKDSEQVSSTHAPQVYLVDFGAVQTLAARESGTMTVVGTYGYMPPEQFGDRTVPASDLYSLGATLIYLVTGTHPADLPQQDGRMEFEPAANLSPTLSHWLRRMTEPSLSRRFTSAREALQALERQLPGDITPLVKKPFGSKVLLTKNPDSLELLMPSKGWSADIVYLTFFAIAWNSGIFMWTSSAVFLAPFGMNLFFALFSLPFWSAGIGMIWRILSTLFRKVRLGLDRQQISQTYEIFGFKYNQLRPAPIQDITQLELECLAEAKHRIIIWAGAQKYELGEYPRLTESELNWLAYELSDWLRVPIQVKRLPYTQSGD